MPWVALAGATARGDPSISSQRSSGAQAMNSSTVMWCGVLWRSTVFIGHILADVQHCLAGEFARQQTAGDAGDIGPWRLYFDKWA